MRNYIAPKQTLDQLTPSQLLNIKALVEVYRNAKDGNQHLLPASWCDDGVYIDTYKEMVCLANSKGQVMFEVMKGFILTHELPSCGELRSMSSIARKFSNASVENQDWSRADVAYLYTILDKDIESWLCHSPNSADFMYAIKRKCLQYLAYPKVRPILDEFLGKHDDGMLQIQDSKHECNCLDGDGWYENELAQDFVNQALSDCDIEIHNHDEFDELAEWIRQQMLSMTMQP